VLKNNVDAKVYSDFPDHPGNVLVGSIDIHQKNLGTPPPHGFIDGCVVEMATVGDINKTRGLTGKRKHFCDKRL
jgi:hypothetical protein